MTDTGCLLATSDNEIGKIGPGYPDRVNPSLFRNAQPRANAQGQDVTFEVTPLPVRWKAGCARFPLVVKTNHSSLPPKGKPGFHAEWLRDGPCDATTTCLGKPGVWCQLSLATAGNMRFGGCNSTHR